MHKIGGLVLGGHNAKNRLLASPKVDRALVILTSRAIIDENYCAIWRAF